MLCFYIIEIQFVLLVAINNQLAQVVDIDITDNVVITEEQIYGFKHSRLSTIIITQEDVESPKIFKDTFTYTPKPFYFNTINH